MNRSTLMAAALAVAALLAGCERPPVTMVQHGYRGTGMDQVYNPRTIAAAASANAMPEDAPPVPSDGPKAGTVFKNVKVLNDLSVAEFTRLMVSMTAWVSPQQGCTYCHVGADFADDGIYTKVVARRMLQMTSHINTDWKTHVAETGVTCYTCHRGQPVPANLWTKAAPSRAGYAGNDAGQNKPGTTVGLTSLPYDPFTPFIEQTSEIRVIGNSALPTGNRTSIKQTEWTYGLMVHMSESLGVNCTYCHNTRSFAQWDSSTPQRSVAWYGIRMARDLNANYLDPLASTFPANRLGPTGDAPKLNCATCHQGAFKPLYGGSMAKNHPELTRVTVGSAAATAAAPVAAASNSAVLLFAVGSAALAPDAGAALAPLVQALAADPTAKATVSGFHSASGDTAQNEELSKQRAFAVRDALKAAGVAEDRVVLEKPQSTEANVAGEDPKARRVEVALSK
jgi:photosynthetic reaction center cytochrome c subunit